MRFCLLIINHYHYRCYMVKIGLEPTFRLAESVEYLRVTIGGREEEDGRGESPSAAAHLSAAEGVH